MQPVSIPRYAEFLAEWQGVGAARRAGADGRVAVVQPLRGRSAPGVVGERDLLPARVRDYTPSLLDSLCADGDLVWVAEGSGDARRARVRFLFRGEGALYLDPPEERPGAAARIGAPYSPPTVTGLVRSPAVRHNPATMRHAFVRWRPYTARWRYGHPSPVVVHRPAAIRKQPHTLVGAGRHPPAVARTLSGRGRTLSGSARAVLGFCALRARAMPPSQSALALAGADLMPPWRTDAGGWSQRPLRRPADGAERRAVSPRWQAYPAPRRAAGRVAGRYPPAVAPVASAPLYRAAPARPP